MKSGCLVAKVLAALVGGALLLVVLFFALVLVRKSMPYVLRGDLEQLAASGPYNSAELATAICGAPVDMLAAAEGPIPYVSLPRARMVSRWQLLYPLEGTASARVSGYGVRRPDWRDAASKYAPVTGRCEAILTFQYRCAWSWNGRATVLESHFVEAPTVVLPPGESGGRR